MKQLGSENWVRVAHTGQAGRQLAIQCGMQMLQVQVNKDGATKEDRESARQRKTERERGTTIVWAGPNATAAGIVAWGKDWRKALSI